MKKRVLLIDESLTVQKVVALTLDRNRYIVTYAKTRGEAIKWITEQPPELILVSDQVSDLQAATFPKEVEAWLGRNHSAPPIVLITGGDLKEAKHYAGILRKPFSPQTLQDLVSKLAKDPQDGMVAFGEHEAATPGEEFEDQRLQKIFHETFADEAKLMKETFKTELEVEEKTFGGSMPVEEENWDTAPKAGAVPPKPQPKMSPGTRVPTPANLWSLTPANEEANRDDAPATSALLTAEDSMAYKAVLESKVETELGKKDLDDVVERVLSRIVPPIVERLVQERLDRLLKEQEQFLELKP